MLSSRLAILATVLALVVSRSLAVAAFTISSQSRRQHAITTSYHVRVSNIPDEAMSPLLCARKGKLHRIWETFIVGSAVVSSRLDTLQAAGIAKPKKETVFHQQKIFFLGHSGLLLVSTIVVLFTKQLWRTIQQSRGWEEVENTGGMMDRCPWPFIFSHDPVQGMKDPPTWIVITWIALWRILKLQRGKI